MVTAQGISQAAQCRVVAVVVTFHPDLSELERQWTALASQVAEIVWVDNGDAAHLHAAAERCGAPLPRVIAMGGNAGIGAAQNAGIRLALRLGASHVLLLDQDSIPHPMMAGRLLAALLTQPDAAAAGPMYLDKRNGYALSPFVQIRGLQTYRLPCDDKSKVWLVDHLIASGCLIPVCVFSTTGMMREDFFIDFVDVEWSLRARSHGHALLGVCDASLSHQLGDRHVMALGRLRHVHSPNRLFFQVRNAFWLYRMPHVSLNWAAVSAWRLFLKCAFYLTCVSPRYAYLRFIFSGVAHGLRGSRSRYQASS